MTCHDEGLEHRNRSPTLDSIDLTADAKPKTIARFAPLGLVANPFAEHPSSSDRAVACEIMAAGNRLLAAVQQRSLEEAPKPLWVKKNGDIPSYYSLNAMSHAESYLAVDDELNVLYSYNPVFTWKIGLVRSTLGVIAERLSFRDFAKTLEMYVAKVLASPDRELASYQVLGPERLADFEERFRSDPVGAIESLVGSAEVERRPELAEVADLRRLSMEDDGEEIDSSAEIDGSVGDAPGTPQLLAEAAERMDSNNAAVFDYLIEYTRAHVSPVVARGTRVYRDRGMVALAEELKVTKAPRKTLARLVEFAGTRYRKVAFIYDSFENWRDIEPDLRSKLVGALSDLRWKMAGPAFPVLVFDPEEAPELEEAFGNAGHVDWSFAGLAPIEEQPGVLLEDVVNAWLEAATLSGRSALTADDPVLRQLAEKAEVSMARFIEMADAAVESAAERGVSALDDEALAAGLEAGS
jgi:hypothetical protein